MDLTRCAAGVAAISLVGFFTRSADSQAPVATRATSGAEIFSHACRTCHDGNDARAPGLEAMRGRSPRAIVDALTAGSMRYQGLALSGDERRAVAEYITGRSVSGSVSGATLGRCPIRPPVADPAANALWNGWGSTIENTHAQPGAQAGLTADQVPRLALKWAFGFPDATSAWAQPTVAGGRLFVGSQNGTVYSLDARTGCIAWTFEAHGGVRASVSIGPRGGGRSASYTAYFSDQNGYAYAVDAASGALLWSHKVDEHPLVRLTGAPTLHDGRLYVPTSSYEESGKPPGYACCTFRGSLVALDAKSGDEVWKAYTIVDRPTLIREYADGTQVWAPSGGAIWSAPTIDVKRGAIYVGVGNTYSGKAQKTTDAVVAFDLKSGAFRWARQMTPGERDVFGCTPGELNCGGKSGPDFDFGASPALVKSPSGRDLIVVAQKSGVAYALDPDRKGQPVWRYRAGGGSGLGGIQWGFAVDREQAYFPVADIYSEMPGGLHAVSLATGKRAWFTPPPPPVCGKPGRACSGAQFSAVTVIPGIVFSPSNDGAVRAYSTRDGAIVWTYDANHDFKTLNGVRARGGSMNGPAPVVAGGIVYVSSGYGAFGLRPGNVLLAFGVP
ncbi:MAG: PQQ-binding-like beta-propeller repeat protein [Acidobacteria bacterium]|nr:PQQ-binding-like beta-propeller repeat protein [Acidobacteriota bacterium]